LLHRYIFVDIFTSMKILTSIKTLQRFFHKQLDQPLPRLILPIPIFSCIYLVIDGIWFGKEFVLLVYRISGWPYIIHHSFAKKEWGWHIANDLRLLRQAGYVFTGIVSDGGTGIESAVNEVYPNIPHQRCLIHLHRQASMGLGKHPRDSRLKKLKQLTDHLLLIESKEALTWWTQEILTWAQKNGDYLREKTHDEQQRKSWFTHRNARKTVRILLSAPQTSFVFVYGHPLCPRTSNEVEGLNALLRRRFVTHTGLAPKRWKRMLTWCIYFRNQHQLSKLRKI